MTRAGRQLDDLRRLGEVAGLVAQCAELLARGDARRLMEAQAAAEEARDGLRQAESVLAARVAVGSSLDPALWSLDVARANHARARAEAAGAVVRNAHEIAEISQSAWLAGHRREEMLDDRAQASLRLYRRHLEDRAWTLVPAGRNAQ